MVRKGGLEPPRYCYRQPLKLVRLPIPPLPRDEVEPSRPGGAPERVYFGVGAGCAGAGCAGAGCAGAGLGGAVWAGFGAGMEPSTEPGPR